GLRATCPPDVLTRASLPPGRRACKLKPLSWKEQRGRAAGTSPAGLLPTARRVGVAAFPTPWGAVDRRRGCAGVPFLWKSRLHPPQVSYTFNSVVRRPS